ncbi:Tat (twin-arginine translocation) pathway signal sequence containing protein [Mycobacterium helveticum]|uniref:Tat (Twin-arginine translocation) pathway signal sequence containing protein n=2 Tax=Mycobacterium helveticum TaxID=2592811 RepID=A0A557Y132_9MYCO|nr:Tat (twin-arginine translocation) pathway signal sequence containing protein [Mycobacterium helveticum]TVS92289.1 Tat (twin-arginine translocation) pathway signal sequence containing protein [Mycobacterium helveticum]
MGAPPSASLGQGLSPNSLGQSFATGMATGQPASAGAQSLSSGAMQAMGTGSAPPPQASPPLAPPVTPSIPVVGGESFTPAGSPIDAATTSSPLAPTTGGGVPVAPAVMTGGSWSAPAAPVAGGPVAPVGPLPAYGSDLRPPVVAPPAMASAPTAPVPGAPVAPSAPSSPSAGGAMVSPVERAASPTAAGQAGPSSSTLAGASVSAATGATAGAVSSRAAEQQRLQRMVDAVARQEPRLSWAAGLRDDGATSLLVTDLAGGWIPPHVRLPAHATLLEPAARRADVSVVDLLGAVVTAAAHEPDAYVAEPGPDAPILSGDRSARSEAPQIDELGPSLVDAVRRRDGLPRIALAVAAPAVRKTGVLENEAALLRACVTDVRHSLLSAYPRHDAAAVADWMLLAAIEALVDDHEYLANYHLAWFNAYTRRGVS